MGGGNHGSIDMIYIYMYFFNCFSVLFCSVFMLLDSTVRRSILGESTGQ